MCKGSNTTTTQSSANPAAMGAYYDLLNRAGGVASQPFQPYGGELTAPINAQQQAGIGSINQNAGFAQPFFDQAKGLAGQAATPLTAENIAQYQSPYTQQVVDATMRQFDQQNKQQQQNVVGNAAMQGALGGDRVGVAQANLAGQQTTAQAPVIAGLYNQGYNTALQTAQGQQQNLGNMAGMYGNLGVAGQNAALTGANAQLGAGNLMYGNEQQRLQAAYDQWKIQQAFPYQQTQWLAGLETGVGSQMGGQSSTTAPPPNPLAQILGLGVAGAGAAGGLGWKPFAASGGRIQGFAGGGAPAPEEGAGGPFSGLGWVPGLQIVRGSGAPKPPNVPQQHAGLDASKLAGFGRGAATDSAGTPLNLTPSGVPGFAVTPAGATIPIGTSPSAGFGMGPLYAHGGPVRGYDDGGLVAGFADRWAPAADAVTDGTFDPRGANLTDIFTAPPLTPHVSDAGIVPRGRSAGAPPASLALEPDDPGDPAMAYAPAARAPRSPIAGVAGGVPFRDVGAGGSRILEHAPGGSPIYDANAPLPGEEPALPPPPVAGVAGSGPAGDTETVDPVDGEEPKRGFDFSSLSMPLMAAGLGMMASRSPNLGNAIGEGGLAGVGAYAQQKQQAFTARKMDQELKRLDQAAERARAALAETTRHNMATEKHQAGLLERESNKMIGINEEGFPVYMDARTGVETIGKNRLGGKDAPVSIGTTKEGFDIKAIRDRASGNYRIIDPTTGRLLEPGELPSSAKPPAGNIIDPRTGKPIVQSDAGDDGVIPANARLVSSGMPHDYSADAPYVEKGMEVPDPAPIAGRSTTAIRTDAEKYLQTGGLPRVSAGKSPVAIQQTNYRNAVQNYAGALAQSRGLTPEQTAEMWRTAPGMLRFILGADGRATVALGTAVRHLDTVQELGKAWAANDTQGINRVRAILSRQFGSNAATNLEAAGQIIGPEIIKALGVAGAGTKEDREKAGALFDTAKSPAQLKGAVDTVQKLLGGQLEGKKLQARNAGVSEERFKSLIGDRPYEILSTAEGKAPPAAGATAAPAVGATPARPSGVPDGSAYSAKLNKWRSPDGKMFDGSGKAVP